MARTKRPSKKGSSAKGSTPGAKAKKDEARKARVKAAADRRAATSPSHPTRRRDWTVGAAAVGVLVIVVFGLGVGDEDQQEDEPDAGGTETATAEPFCVAFDRLDLATEDIVTATAPVATTELKAAAREVGELAPDTDMGPEARAGVDLMVASILGLSEEATADDLRAFDETATRADLANARALVDHVTTVCREGVNPLP